ncbi:PREDICTED: uncharacterized protein LOC104825306 [Tarenaya hassleriana]|uniref:uncharacterized protein LOC104825306 n=1 Tax=Tarenaya hassleriana TaxID=28532 RepID=UPI00053C8451|nr:PREDICTED: uncharacterized protein LOC104825306 [Tarenaya hassleriana]
MAGSDMKWVSRLIFWFLISSQLWGFSVPNSPLQHNFEGYKNPGDGRAPKQKEDSFPAMHCSRERSRAAWKIVQEYLMPFVEKDRYQLPTSCRLHRDNDIYREQEEHKMHVDINEWQCGYCQKTFYEEKFLDKHFDNRHHHLLNRSHGRCLADLCGALHCDLMIDAKKPKSKCNPAAAARNRHLCESLADSCFPVNKGPSASRLHEFFLRQFCDAHACTGGSKPLSRKIKKKSVFYIAASIITLMLLPLFYSFVYLYQRGLRSGTRELKRITRHDRPKKKPY